jgi:putative endonuclease
MSTCYITFSWRERGRHGLKLRISKGNGRIHASWPRKEYREMADWTVYILACADGSLYTGITNDLPHRLAAHAAGTASRYTRSRLPVRLAHQEAAPDRAAALRREAAIKRLSRPQKLALCR